MAVPLEIIELNLVVLIVLIALSGVFSGVEIAFFSLGKLKVRRLVKKGSENARIVEELLKNPRSLLVAILIGNNLVNILSAAIATNLALSVFEGSPAGIALSIATGIMTFMILLFGEIAPKSIAIHYNSKIALFFALPMKLLMAAIYPLVFVMELISTLMLGVLGVTMIEKKMTEEEVRSMVTMGAEEGAINKEEKEMIHRIFQFNDIPAHEAMTSRVEVVALDINASKKEILKISQTPYSRIPVYEGNIDHIIGVLHIKDLLRVISRKKRIDLKRMVSKPLFVPETKKIDQLMRQLQKERLHMAIVVDDYGVTQGIVTFEDLLEEIVGEIEDESDTEPKLKQINDMTFEAEGGMHLDDIREQTGLTFSSEEYDTIGGFVLEKLGTIPKKGEKIELPNATIVALKVDENRIVMVRIIKKRI
ncbi:MAG: hemolysin family protein [Candidatus Diapherotrites archaeon]